ncbi:AraC family transcriptional regulator [Amycolatopsis sp. VS8301801F10]|uniref:AraC family transcriptional regulator n=1 Tax=Amycolatopsis sp. VS8301801F10 TaxID=2652442 RepID=UPI0038FC6ACE
MDAVAELLADVRAHGAVFRQTITPSLRVAPGTPLTLARMLRGEAWIVPDGLAPVRIGENDIAVVRGDVPYVVADDPTTTPVHTVTTADYCPTPTDGRTCGTPAENAAVLLSGAFESRGQLSGRVLRLLPEVLVVPAESPHPSAEAFADEVGKDQPGQQQVLDRMLDLMLVSALRTWFDTAPVRLDPVVSTAMRRIREDPARRWTVAELAAEAGVSRAAFARRFTEQVGEPPIAHLAGWRISLAADLLRRTEYTVDTIARKVGYANAFALSVAFKRRRGIRPSEHRHKSSV